MFCSSCGGSISNKNAPFCTNCGVKLNAQANENTPNVAPQSPPPSETSYRPSYAQQMLAAQMAARATAPGKNFLLVTGILIIVFSAFGILSNMAMFLTSGFWDDFLPTGNMSWSTYYGVAIVIGIYELIMGIMGVANRTKPRVAGLLMVLAIVAIIITVVWSIVSSIALDGMLAGLGIFGIFGIGFGLILPILYLVGASKNNQANRSSF